MKHRPESAPKAVAPAARSSDSPPAASSCEGRAAAAASYSARTLAPRWRTPPRAASAACSAAQVSPHDTRPLGSSEPSQQSHTPSSTRETGIVLAGTSAAQRNRAPLAPLPAPAQADVAGSSDPSAQSQ